MIKVRPVRDVFLHEEQETNIRTDGRTNIKIKGALRSCCMHVCKVSQPLIGKTTNTSIKFNLAGKFNCW